jgi:hypothetical protein
MVEIDCIGVPAADSGADPTKYVSCSMLEVPDYRSGCLKLWK